MSNPHYNKNQQTSSNGKTPTPSRVDPKFADLLRGKSPNGSFLLINGKVVIPQGEKK